MSGTTALKNSESCPLTDRELLDSEKILIEDNPLRLVVGEFLSIKTKDGRLIKLKLNSTQQKLFDKILELRRAKKPIRIWLLKYRQGGICLAPETKILTKDLKWITLKDVEIGEEIFAVEEKVGNGKGIPRKMKVGIVEKKRNIIKDAFKITLEDNRILIATGEHRFLSKKDNHSRTVWKTVRKMKPGDALRHITYPWSNSNYEDGWMGGIIDGEGSIRRTERSGYDLKITQLPGLVCERIRDYLVNNRYNFQEKTDNRPAKEGGKFSSKPITMFFLSRIDELIRLIGKTRPIRLIDKVWWENKSLPCRRGKDRAWIKIIKIESVGKKRMIDLQTSTKTFIAEGLVSHNSTESEAIIYALTSQQSNRNSLIMADEEDKSGYLFQMSKLYQEELEKSDPHIPPTLKKSNAKALEFEHLHSQIIIDTAKNVDAARAFTYQYVHLSEVARFPNLRAVLDALNQSVPDHWDTIILGETTANGMEEFYQEWQRAIKGQTDWIPLFFPWFMMEEYRLPLQGGQLYSIEGVHFSADTSIVSFEKEEQKLGRKFNLDDTQLNWRRWCIVNKCQGSINTFKQEYPATWEEAFITSGALYFDSEGLAKQLKKRPLALGEIFFQNLKWEFRDLPHGRIEIFEKPQDGEQYIIIQDASEGVDADEAAILVLNKRMNSTAAIVAGQHTPEEIAQMGIGLANFYNQGLLVPENKGYGYQVGQLDYQNYGNVYRKMVDKDGIPTATDEIGFNTNSVTRPQMLAQLAEEIKNNATVLNSEKLINECYTFVIKRDKDGNVVKIEAQDGVQDGKRLYQDGLVVCRAIGSYVRNQFPYKPIETKDQHAKQRAAVEERHKKRGFGG